MVPVPTFVRMPPAPPLMPPAYVLEVLLPPVVRVDPNVRLTELVVLALAREPMVLLKPNSERTPLLLIVTALRPDPPKALVEPPTRRPLLMTVAPEWTFVPESVFCTDPFSVTPPVPVIAAETVTEEFSLSSSVPLSAMPLVEAMVPLVVPLPSCRFAPPLIVVVPVYVLALSRISVPVPASVRPPPAPEMTPAKVVEVLFPPVVSVVAPRVMELVALALAMEPTVLLWLRARMPLLLTVTALRPVAPPKALTDPAVRVPLL